MKKNKIYFWLGIFILLILIASYFLKINIDAGANYSVETRLLGILIFYKPYMLGLYILITVVLIIIGLKKRK